jgi:hypothetical protein
MSRHMIIKENDDHARVAMLSSLRAKLSGSRNVDYLEQPTASSIFRGGVPKI